MVGDNGVMFAIGDFSTGTKEPASKIQVVGLCSVPKSYKLVL